MKLSAIRIFVDDLAAAEAFYGDTLGLTGLWSDAGVLGFDVGAATLIVEPALDGHDGLTGRFAGVSFEVDDIDAAVDRLAARGVAFWGPPERQEWGGRLAHFRDPAGNTLTLVGR